MDVKILKLVSEMQLNPGTSEAMLRTVQSDIRISFPADYADFMLKSNGAEGSIGNWYLVLWPIEEIEAINEDYSVSDFAPGFLLFGSDGGGEAYAFDMKSGGMPIFEIPFIPLEAKEARLCGRTFVEFLEFLHDHD